MKSLISIILLLILPSGILSQDLSGLREKTVIADTDTIKLDTLRIVPGTLVLRHSESGYNIDERLYKSDPVNSLLLIGRDFPYFGKELVVSYRVFTFDPELRLAAKDTSIIIPYQGDISAFEGERYSYRPVSDDIWKEEALVRTGSISRGVSFGNNQDVIVNSNLNLQLSGKLDDNINILASISDQNIPLQPEGYSRQIHEFDKIFIQLYNDDLSLTAGDLEIRSGEGLFLPFEKKAQGMQFRAITEPGSGPVETITNSASAAIAKGRFHRNSFRGIEGNQGPYKLSGANNELFIIVLAGTERVFVDGRLLSRGVDRDYTIDYNLAEITFTSNMPVTRDRRIVVEFEYSDRNYTRFLLANSTEISTGKGDYFINILSEHDARNQPLLHDLKEEEKELLSRIGDSLHLAWTPRIDSVEFRNDMVLYGKIDTTVNDITYTILKHTTDPGRAHYRAGFSFVGENSGNYKPKISSSNGRVFEWVAPANGVPSGSHEPVRLLVAPNKHQIINIGGAGRITENTEAFAEIALSNFDRNTFSAEDNDDNAGLAFRLGLQSIIPLDGEGRILGGEVDYEYLGVTFNTTERFRPVEYERDWNISGLTKKSDEQKVRWHALYRGGDGEYAGYTGEYLDLRGIYKGLKNTLEGETEIAGFDNFFMIDLMNSRSNFSSTGFLKHSFDISRSFGTVRIGIRSEGEQNRLETKYGKQLLASSFAFHQKEIYIRNEDTAGIHLFAAYRERADKLPFQNNLQHSSSAKEISAGFSKDISTGNRLAGSINHRRLNPESFNGQNPVPVNSLTGRMENALRLFNGIVEGAGFYETGSGLEVKKDFMFIEVAKGLGTHTWTDYNENGIKEIDEFEPAIFPDQANYIRILIPGDDFVSVRSNHLSQGIRLNPPATWANGNNWERAASFFTNRANVSSAKKTIDTALPGGLNPFFSDIADTNLVKLSLNLRNILSFRPGNRSLSIEYLHQRNMSKDLLAIGSDLRRIRSDAIHIRFDLHKHLVLSNQVEKGTRQYNSEFFPGRDYNINLHSAMVNLNYQPGFKMQSSLHIKTSRQENKSGNERADRHNLGTEFNYTVPSRGNLILRADYYHVRFNERVNSPVAWEMLEGLRPGNNMTIMVQYQQNITGNLQMSLNYNGRVSEGNRFIHTGGLDMRAYF